MQVSRCLFLIGFFFTSWVQAEERIFQVEMIIFQQSAPNTELFEQTEREIAVVRRYVKTEVGTKTMASIYRRLDKSADYRPFFYKSWRLGVKSGQVSLPIHISLANENLEGWVKVQRGHLLHVITDLEYSPKGLVETEDLIYRINEKRRVLLNEVHYLDHPYFGVVVKVSPIE